MKLYINRNILQAQVDLQQKYCKRLIYRVTDVSITNEVTNTKFYQCDSMPIKDTKGLYIPTCENGIALNIETLREFAFKDKNVNEWLILI